MLISAISKNSRKITTFIFIYLLIVETQKYLSLTQTVSVNVFILDYLGVNV